MLPRCSFGIRPLLLLVCYLTLLPVAIGCKRFQNYALFGRVTCNSGIPFHSSNWQATYFICFKYRSYDTLLVHYFQITFQLFFAMPYCSILFILSEQYSVSRRISVVVLPDGQGKGSKSFAGAPAVNIVTEGFCNKHLHF